MRSFVGIAWPLPPHYRNAPEKSRNRWPAGRGYQGIRLDRELDRLLDLKPTDVEGSHLRATIAVTARSRADQLSKAAMFLIWRKEGTYPRAAARSQALGLAPPDGGHQDRTAAGRGAP